MGIPRPTVWPEIRSLKSQLSLLKEKLVKLFGQGKPFRFNLFEYGGQHNNLPRMAVCIESLRAGAARGRGAAVKRWP
jgi:hypothetical protein